MPDIIKTFSCKHLNKKTGIIRGVFEWQKYIMLAAGIIIIIASAFLLAEANARQAGCESISGKIVRLLDVEKEKSCANVKTMQSLSYAGLAVGVALVVGHFMGARK
jgi:hypothetical protein